MVSEGRRCLLGMALVHEGLKDLLLFFEHRFESLEIFLQLLIVLLELENWLRLGLGLECNNLRLMELRLLHRLSEDGGLRLHRHLLEQRIELLYLWCLKWTSTKGDLDC